MDRPYAFCQQAVRPQVLGDRDGRSAVRVPVARRGSPATTLDDVDENLRRKAAAGDTEAVAELLSQGAILGHEQHDHVAITSQSTFVGNFDQNCFLRRRAA